MEVRTGGWRWSGTRTKRAYGATLVCIRSGLNRAEERADRTGHDHWAVKGVKLSGWDWQCHTVVPGNRHLLSRCLDLLMCCCLGGLGDKPPMSGAPHDGRGVGRRNERAKLMRIEREAIPRQSWCEKDGKWPLAAMNWLVLIKAENIRPVPHRLLVSEFWQQVH